MFDALERGRAVSRRLTAVSATGGRVSRLLAELRATGESSRRSAMIRPPRRSARHSAPDGRTPARTQCHLVAGYRRRPGRASGLDGGGGGSGVRGGQGRGVLLSRP